MYKLLSFTISVCFLLSSLRLSLSFTYSSWCETSGNLNYLIKFSLLCVSCLFGREYRDHTASERCQLSRPINELSLIRLIVSNTITRIYFPSSYLSRLSSRTSSLSLTSSISPSFTLSPPFSPLSLHYNLSLIALW